MEKYFIVNNNCYYFVKFSSLKTLGRLFWQSIVRVLIYRSKTTRTRDPRTAWSADRSVRVGPRFFRFLWSWCGPEILKFFWSWCGAVLKFHFFFWSAGPHRTTCSEDRPALVRGSLPRTMFNSLKCVIFDQKLVGQ